jgi:hypothetical protein
VWERVNLYCEIGSICVSLVLAPILILTIEADWLRLAIMAAVSTVVVLAAAWFMPPTEPATLMSFYDRVRPPGWWSHTARALELDTTTSRQALRRDIVAVIAAAISVYAWLVGLAQLLLQTASVGFAVMLLVAGTVMVPVWRRAL